MTKKLTKDEIENKIKELVDKIDNVELISISFKGNNIKATNALVTMRCTIHDEIFTVTYHSVAAGIGHCKKCASISYSKARLSDQEKSINELKEHIRKANELGSDLEYIGISGEWKGKNNTEVFIKCRKHNTTTKTRIANIMHSDTWRCGECMSEFLKENNSHTPKEAREIVEKRFPDSQLDFSKIEDTYIGADKEVTIHCKKHGDFTRVYKALLGEKNPQCPDCYNESRTFTKEEAENIVIENVKSKNEGGADIEFLGFVDNIWSGNTTKLILKCNKHNKIWDTTDFHNFCGTTRVGCTECGKELSREHNMYTSEEALEIVKDAQSSRSDEFSGYYKLERVIDSYTGSHDSVTLECPKHGLFDISFSIVSHGGGYCPECLKEKRVTDKLSEVPKLVENINNKLDELRDQGYDIKFLGFIEEDSTSLVNRHLKLRCNEHDRYWESTIYSNFIKCVVPACPDCNRYRSGNVSKQEMLCVNEILKYTSRQNVDTGIKIAVDEDSRKIFDNRSGFIWADIYIRNINTIIEYSGQQHFKFPSYFHHSYYEFVNQVNRDLFLQRYCKYNNIRLIIIPYVDDNRIPEIIKNLMVDGIDITTKVVPRLLPDVVKETCKSLVRYG